MKIKEITRYQCEICEQEYTNKADAVLCSERPTTQDKGVKIGDQVRVLKGDGIGEIYTVSSVYFAKKEWGHYAWETFWHTPIVVAEKNGWSRVLAFDSYEKVDVQS